MSDWKETEIGIIPKDWEILSLTKIIEFTVDNRGKTVPIIDKKTDYPLIATNCIKESALFPVKENLRFLTEDTYKTWFRAHPQHGDIIIVNKGTPGLVCFVPDPVDFCIAQDMVAIRVNEKIYNKFLFAYMRSDFFKYQVKGLNVGTTIPHLKKTNFKSLNIPIPPRKYQKVSGDLYYILSLKIENLRRQNETLEQIAQTLFKHWFIDFEFPNADGKPYKSSGGAMVASELGDIPEGWRVAKFSTFFDLLSGGTPKTNISEYWGGSIKWLSAKDVTHNHKHFILETEKTITNKGLQKSAAKLLPKYTTIVSARGTVGNYCLLSQEMAISQSNFGVSSKSSNQIFFGHLLMASLIERLKSQAYGSVFDTVTASTFNDLNILIPKSNLIKDFENQIISVFQKNLLNKKQIQTLTKIRDALLPKLMSGQIRVKE